MIGCCLLVTINVQINTQELLQFVSWIKPILKIVAHIQAVIYCIVYTLCKEKQ